MKVLLLLINGQSMIHDRKQKAKKKRETEIKLC